MIKKLKRKFVLVTTLSITLILTLIVVVSNVINYNYIDSKFETSITLIEENNGSMPSSSGYRDTTLEIRYFIAYYNSSNEVTSMYFGNSMYIDNTLGSIYVSEVLSSEKTQNYIDGYKYKVTTINGENAIIFVDIARELETSQTFLLASIGVSIIAIILTFIISKLLSSYAIKPIALSYDKQRKFITNSSHEIKTPLTIISANIDIMEMSGDSSEWTENTKKQLSRLTELVNNLISLSRMEEVEKIEKYDTNISDMAEMACESFDAIAKTQSKLFNVEIEKDIIYKVNEQSVSQLLYILLDNAFKYSLSNGEIDFMVSKKQGKLKLVVSNETSEISDCDIADLFDRFYRGDKSRNSKNNGFGIGLALAKSIVDAHSGKIYAKFINNKFVIEVLI